MQILSYVYLKKIMTFHSDFTNLNSFSIYFNIARSQ